MIMLSTIQQNFIQAYIQSNLSINQNFYIRPLHKQISLFGSLSHVLEVNITQFAIYHLYYKEKSGIIEFAHDLFFVWPLLKLLSLLSTLSDCIIKFATYHLNHKDKFGGNFDQNFIYIANCLYFLYGWKNLSVAFFFGHNSNIQIAEPGIVTKKGKLPKTSLYLLFHLF